MLDSNPVGVAQCESAKTFARSGCCEAHVPPKRFELSGRYFQNPLHRIGSAISRLCPDSDNLDNRQFGDGVAARSPGKASSYLSAMKGEARRRRRMLGSEGTAADPDRESCRFHRRNSGCTERYKLLVPINSGYYMTYAEKLRDPRWQKRRLELLQAADWTCQICLSKTDTLHVHHGCYRRNTEPWEYPDRVMHVYCDECHGMAQRLMEDVHEQLGGLGVTGLILVKNLFSNLHDAENLGEVLDVIREALEHAQRTGHWPEQQEDGQYDYEWLQRMVLGAAMETAGITGFNQGFDERNGKSALTEVKPKEPVEAGC